MVTSILPGAAGVGALGVDSPFNKGPALNPGPSADARPRDRVELSGGALAAVRESVRAGMAQAHAALALGQDAQAMLVNLQALLRSGGSQAEANDLLSAFAKRVEDAIAQGNVLSAGEDVQVQAEPGAAPLTISGVDLRLKEDPSDEDVIAVAKGASLDEPDLAKIVQQSLDALQAAMTRLLDTVRGLEAHQGFVGAAEKSVVGVRHDLNADSARLLALQVRQGLESVGPSPIANVEPQAVLALFRN